MFWWWDFLPFLQKPKGKKMKINAEGLALIKLAEGCHLKPYLCPADVWTIGYGHTKGITGQTLPITKEEAEELLKEDLAYFENGVEELVTNLKMNQNQFAALVSFAYNVGLGNLKRSTLLKMFNDGHVLAASEQFVRWNKAGGKVLRGLTRRRHAEKELFLKPVVVK